MDPVHRRPVPDAARPRAVVRERQIICDSCNRAADAIHLLPSAGDVRHIQAACYEHDPGGYDINLHGEHSLSGRPFEWLHMVREKDSRGAALIALLDWLGHEGCIALDRDVGGFCICGPDDWDEDDEED